MWSAEPDKMLVEVNFEGIGKVREGTNGEVAWATNPMQGPRIKDGEEKAQALLQAKFNAESEWRDVYKSATTVALEKVEGKDCYKILLTPKAGSPMTRWYDKETNLLIKNSSVNKSPMGDMQAETVFSDYRKEGDILMPHKMALQAAGQDLAMTITKVQQNADLPKGTFDLPDDVKALVEKPAPKQ